MARDVRRGEYPRREVGEDQLETDWSQPSTGWL